MATGLSTRPTSGEPPLRRALLVSFDIARDRDLVPSYAVASLLAYLRSRSDHGERFEIEHASVPIDGRALPEVDDVVARLASRHALDTLDLVALAAYAWSEPLVLPVLRGLRAAGFRGDFALGGYQIADEPETARLYPDARYLIVGPGEASLYRLLTEPVTERVLADPLPFANLVSPYLAGVLDVPHGARMVRMETQRGCRWSCSFCRYPGDLNRLAPLPLERVRSELALFASRMVGKINVLDPEFNGRRKCLEVLDAMISAGLHARISVQARPENLAHMSWAPDFLDRCAELDICLEFGLQTVHAVESEAIGRKNDMARVWSALAEVQRRGIDHEFALIYGLPHQTVASFRASIEALRDRGTARIRCYPLMLTRGTRLSRERERYALSEDVIDGFGIPHVTSSASFTRADWTEMHRLAGEVNKTAGPSSRPSPLVVPEIR